MPGLRFCVGVIELDAVRGFLLDFLTALEGDVFAVLEHVENDVIPLMLAPAAKGGIGRAVHMAVGKGRLQVSHHLLVHGVFVGPIVAVEQPQAFQMLKPVQGRPVLDAVEADVQVDQLGAVGQAGDIVDVVLEQFQIFQILQAAHRGDILQVDVAGQDQYLQVGQVIEEGYVHHGIVADIQRLQVFAVLEVLELLLGMHGRAVVVQGGESRGIGAHPVIADAHRPAELDVRAGFGQLVNVLGVHVGGEHVHLPDVGQLAQKCDEFVHLRHANLAQVDVLRVDIAAELSQVGYGLDGLLRQRRALDKQAQEQQECHEFLLHDGCLPIILSPLMRVRAQNPA